MKNNRGRLAKELNKVERMIDDEIERLLCDTEKELDKIFEYDNNRIKEMVIGMAIREEKDCKVLFDIISEIIDYRNFVELNIVDMCYDKPTYILKKEMTTEGTKLNKLLRETSVRIVLLNGIGASESMQYIEYTKFKKRIENKIQKYIRMIYDDYKLKILSEIETYYDLVMTHIKNGKWYNAPVETITEDAIKPTKIFDHKEMDIHLKQQGYEPIRQTGSHKMYKKDSKVVPVPQHTLGKGISMKIQKQAMIG